MDLKIIKNVGKWLTKILTNDNELIIQSHINVE